jgi:hypothetical protein
MDCKITNDSVGYGSYYGTSDDSCIGDIILSDESALDPTLIVPKMEINI